MGHAVTRRAFVVAYRLKYRMPLSCMWLLKLSTPEYHMTNLLNS